MDPSAAFAGGVICGIVSSLLGGLVALGFRTGRFDDEAWFSLRKNPGAAGVGHIRGAANDGAGAAPRPLALSRDSARPGQPPRPAAQPAVPTYPIVLRSSKRPARPRRSSPPCP